MTVTTDPVMTNTDVTVSATLAGVTKSRDVLIKAPVLSSMGLQTVIRHGGVGKVIARISGPAPAGGFAVNTETDPSGHLDLDAVITIPAGETETQSGGTSKPLSGRQRRRSTSRPASGCHAQCRGQLVH